MALSADGARPILARQAGNRCFPPPVSWPRIAAVIPAHNEAEIIATTIRSLTTQNYPGELGIVLVDDLSDDGTDDFARAVAAEGTRPIVVLRGTEL